MGAPQNPRVQAAGARPPQRRLIRAGCVADGAGCFAAPGALLLEGDVLLAAGAPESIGAPLGAEVQELPEACLLPAFVNAHAHLDLTALGCRPFGGEFDAWLSGIRAARAGMQDAALLASVRQGVQALTAGGVAAVGDIASAAACEPVVLACRAAGVAGVAFAEVFGMGPRRAAALAAVAEVGRRASAEVAAGAGGAPARRAGRADRLHRGLQPHAPYSSDAQVFEAALASGLPVSTHLAESADETHFLRSGQGPFRALLESLGLWDGSFQVGARHPVDWIAARLAGAPGHRILAAHVNQLDDTALLLLAALPVDVVYCPRASDYFGHRGHRYRAMRAAGVNVCLGTDSMVCLDTPDRLSTLDEARLLMRRDGLPLGDALAMATVAGARALGCAPAEYTLAPGEKPGLIAVAAPGFRAACSRDAVASVLGGSSGAPTWLIRAGHCVVGDAPAR